MNKAPLIEVDNLCIDFPRARVVNNVSFQLGQERLALVGESGSGKSMTARSLMGLVRKPGKVSADKLHFMGDDLLAYSLSNGTSYEEKQYQWYYKILVMH